MKLIKTTQNSVKVIFLALALNACAGDDASMEDPIEGNEENAANVEDEGDNFGNGNGNENMNAENGGNNENLNNENLGNNGEMANESANEFVNNAAGENFLGGGNGNIAAEEPATDPSADTGLAENSSEDLGIQPSGDIVGGNQNAAAQVPPDPSMGATDSSLAVPADSAPAPTEAAPTPAAPVTGGRVHYVMKGGASAYDKPSGQVVKTYEQGDHPLVTADGEWAQTSDGVYLQRSSITAKPVSRAKSPKSWR